MQPSSLSAATATAAAPIAPVLPAALRLGATHLTVSDLDRSVAWYQRSLGFRVHTHEPTEAHLGDGRETTIVLHEDSRAQPAGRHAGLYHYALLYPSREELARAAIRLAVTQTPIQGASDHGTHEAIYLPDPDGNGIELAADRPRSEWPTPEEEFGRGGPLPLNLDDLLATVAHEAPAEQIQPGLRTGHLHLHVGDIEQGLAFYRDTLGFEVWALLPTAAFVSAGGYHHHVGFNTWQGRGVGPAPEHTVGLRHWTIQLPTEQDVAEVRARVEGAGLTAEGAGLTAEGAALTADGAGLTAKSTGAFTVRDPWRNAVRVEVAP